MARLTLASLLIRLGLDQKEYEREMKNARRKTKQATRGIKQDLKGVQGGLNTTARFARNLAGALAITAGAGGFGAMVAGAQAAEHQLGITSLKLGVNKQELVELRLAAERYSGFVDGQFDTALQRMVRRVAEAAKGTGEAKGALEELGLDLVGLARLSPDEQFRAIAEAMQQVESQGDRVRLSFKLFDTEGVGLVNTLNAGTDAMETIGKEAVDFGLALNAVDSQALLDAKFATDRLGDAWEGAGKRLAVAISPATQVVADAYTDAIVQAGELLATNDALGRAFVIMGGVGLDWLRFIAGEFQILSGLAGKAAVGIDMVKNGLAGLGIIGEENITPVGELFTRAFEAEKQFTEGTELVKAVLAGEESKVTELLAKYDELIAKRGEAGAAAGAAPRGSGTGFNYPDVPEGLEAGMPAGDLKDLEAPSGPADPQQPGDLPWGGDAYEQMAQAEEIAEAERKAQEERLEAQRQFVEDYLGLEKGMVDDLIDLTKKSADGRAEITAAGALTVAKAVTQIGASLFKDNKAFAIAEAIINTHQGITKALASAPPPQSYLLAAAVAAKGFASVKAIASAQKGSRSGSHHGGGYGGGGRRDFDRGLSAPTPANDNRGRVEARHVTIQFAETDRKFTRDEVIEIVNTINELSGDGVEVQVQSGASL